MSDIAIEVCNVWKKFHRGELHDSLRDLLPSLTKHFLRRKSPQNQLGKGDFWALQDINFAVKRGEALGIIGPNGAGKSTTLKILSRILRPDRGHIRVYGRLSALIEVSSGFHPDLTGRENIYLNGAILGMKKSEIDRSFKEIVEFSGIEAFIDTPVKRYSSGMQARLGFSVMAHINPEILLVDEVLSVGDAAFRAKCIRRMSELLRDSHVSVIFISHNLDQIRQLCDRCLVLDGGAVRFIGNVEEACEQYFESLRHQNNIGNHLTDEHADSAGCLLGLTIYDDQKNLSFRVPSHCPLTLEIGYSLNQDFDHIALGVSFYKADGRFISNCNTVKDEKKLPASMGKHKASLSLEGLPFYSGDYLVSIKLIDVSNEQELDFHDHKYPLIIEGCVGEDHAIHLKHCWDSMN